MQATATAPQLVALAGVTGLMLVAGLAAPAGIVNLGLAPATSVDISCPPA